MAPAPRAALLTATCALIVSYNVGCGPAQTSGGPPSPGAGAPAAASSGEPASPGATAADSGAPAAAPGGDASAAGTGAAAAPGPGGSSSAGVAAGGRATFHCFSWVHGPEFSTDCYRTAAECDREQLSMKNGARDTTGCQPVQGAVCTRVSRPPDPADHERCFSDAGRCAHYQAFVTGNGHAVTPCVAR